MYTPSIMSDEFRRNLVKTVVAERRAFIRGEEAIIADTVGDVAQRSDKVVSDIGFVSDKSVEHQSAD